MSFSFGTPSSAPATTGLTGGFSFGANKPPSTGFGLTATTQATGLFGTPATSAPAFGTVTGSAPAFGTTPAFGAAAPTFGANTSFGATTNAPAFGATSSLSFGVSSAAPAFGASTPAFGATTTPAFGANTSFGTGGLNFGSGTSTAASTGLSFGTTTTTSTGLGGLGGFGFGTSTQSNWSLGSTATTTTSAFGNQLGATNVTGTQLSTSAAPSLGLGGVAQSGITNTTTTDGKSEPPMQQKLPNEISTTVESFKEFLKKQKTLSSDIMRISIKPLHKVSQEAETTLRAVAALRGECGRARAQCRRLRAAAAAALAAAETAARDVPGPDLEGPIPPQYVAELISELEQQLTTFRRQMDVADKQMQSSPKLLTEQELTLGIRRMHESLVALAARLQAAHALVAAQKDQYLNLRKYILKDPTDVFDTTAPNASLDQILRDVEGTRKKKSISDIGLGSSVLSDPRTTLGNIQQLAGPTPFTYLGNSISSLPATDNTGSNWQPQPQTNLNTSLNLSFGIAQNDSGFQLQKPPGKRGKQ